MTERNNSIFTQEQLVRQETRTVHEESKKEYSKMTKTKTFLDGLTNTEFTALKNESMTKQNVSKTCQGLKMN